MSGPDRGWSWVVVFAALVINLIMVGLTSANGILFLAHMEFFDIDRKTALIPFTVRIAMRNLLGPVAGILGRKYGARKTIIIGSLISGCTFAISFFAPNITWITFISVFIGVGAAFNSILHNIVVVQYFDKYRSAASGINYSGTCIGSFLFPALVELLLQNFGFQGTLLILGAIIMHCIPAGMILRKPPWTKLNNTQKNAGISTQSKSTNSLKACVTNINEKKIDNINQYSIQNFVELVAFNSGSTEKAETNDDVYPDLTILKDNRDLVEKILNYKIEMPIRNSQESNEKETITFDEIENLCKLLYEYGKTSQSLTNIDYAENINCASNSKDYSTPKIKVFHISQTTPENKLLRFENTPDFSILATYYMKKQLILQNTLNLEQLNSNVILSMFGEQKNCAAIVFKELVKLKRLCSEVDYTLLIDSLRSQEKNILNRHSTSLKDTKSNSYFELTKSALKLYLNPFFLLISLCCSVTVISFITTNTIIVDFFMDKGFQEKEGKFVIAALFVGDLLGRLCFGWITDKGFLTLPRFMVVAMNIQGIITVCLPLMHAKWAFLVGLSVFGILQGLIVVRYPVLIMKYMKSEERSIATGCSTFFAGCLLLVIPFYIGYFRDVIGSYHYIFYINGVICATVGLLWSFDSTIQYCVSKNCKVAF